MARDAGHRGGPGRKGRPQQNCYVERFNGIMRDELLSGELLLRP
ncbi:integrase core domain-containing protein [Lapillicoccus jejuensis]